MVRYTPDLVVIAYVGNTFSRCINGTSGKDIYLRHYLDAQRLVSAIGNRPIVLDTPPGNIGQGHDTAYDALVDVEASTFDATVADTSAALIDSATRRFERSMPCRPVLTNCRRNKVRSSHGYHLTPVGAFLYARVLAQAVVKQFRITTLQPAH
jgi:hypothetical protein